MRRRRQSSSECALSSFLLREASIYGLDEIVRRTIALDVSARGRRCLDLFQCHSCFDQISNAVPDDRYHVAILDDVELIAHAAVTGNHDRAFLARGDRHRWK